MLPLGHLGFRKQLSLIPRREREVIRDQHCATHSAGDFYPESCHAGEVVLMDPEGPINGS